MANSLASPVPCHHKNTLRNPGSQKYFNPSTLSLKIGLKPKIEEFLLFFLSDLLTWLELIVIWPSIKSLKKYPLCSGLLTSPGAVNLLVT